MADDAAPVDQYNGDGLLITVVLFQILTWISVGLRTYVRAFMTKSFQYDDWLMLISQINFTLSCAFICAGLTSGLGYHNTALPQWQEIPALKWQALATGTYISNMMFIKLSIGVFLLRLAQQRRYKWIIWISMGIIALMSSALFLWDIFQCKPVAAQWDYTLPDYKCVTPDQVVDAAYALSTLSVVSDWLYALLPVPMLYKAKMHKRNKITVGLILGLGIFASIATLIRVKFLIDLTNVDDILYFGTDPMIWTLVEPGVAIVAASLVTIRPLLRQMRLKGFESSERSRSGRRSVRFWQRYGRSAYGEQTAGSRRSRATSGMDSSEPNGVSLKDIEAGRMAPICKAVGTTPASCETTLTSRTSTQDRDFGQGPLRKFSAPLKIAVQKRTEEIDSGFGENDDDDDDDPPVSPWLMHAGAHTIGGEAGLSLSQQPATLRGHVKNGRTMWRSETPNSAEEAEAIQGLRKLSSRTNGRSPFS